MKKILLTWWAWYIGSHCAVQLLEQGYDVLIFDNLCNADRGIIESIQSLSGKQVRFFEGDMKLFEEIDQCIEEFQPDCIIHLAWLKAAGESCERTFEYYENNIVGSLHVLKAMERNGVKDLVFSSSAILYDTSLQEPFTEQSPLACNNPYGTTKRVIEHLLEDMCINHDFRCISLRYFNPIWAHPSWVIGESIIWKPNNILPALIQSLMDKTEFRMYGDNHPTEDGTPIRDYIHILDLVEAHSNSIDTLASQSPGFFITLNIWTGKWTSVKQMIDSAQETLGKRIQYVIDEERSWDVPFLVCDPSKAQKILWWKAKRTISQAVEDAWRFTQSNQKNPWTSQ